MNNNTRIEFVEDGVTEKERYIFDIVDYLLHSEHISPLDIKEGLKHIRRVTIPTSKFYECEDCNKYTINDKDDNES